MGNKDQPTPTAADHATSSVLCSATIANLLEEGEDFLIDLIDLFMAEAPMRLAMLTTAVAESDDSTAQRTAHTIKSTAAVFGAEALTAIAAAMEMSAQAGESSEVARLLPPLRAATERVRLALIVEREKVLARRSA